MTSVAPKNHSVALDGLRGLAILLVFILHTITLPDFGYTTALHVLALGHYGVDVFFCLSGFLITGILYRNKVLPYYFRNFYGRRTLRIFPLYYLYLFLYYELVVRLKIVNFGASKTAQAASDLHWTWFYATNLAILVQGHYVTASLNLFWTLAIEEHFYLVWPLIILWLSPKRLLGAVGIISVVALALRTFMLHHGFPGYVVGTFTLCRIDSFAIGGAASVLLSLPEWRQRLVQIAPLAVGPMLALFLVIQFRLGAPAIMTYGYTVLAIALSLVIVCATVFTESKWVAIFRSRPMTFLGKYSYSLYVFHVPIQILISRKLPIERIMNTIHNPVAATIFSSAIVGILSIGVALMTWNLYEKHFLALKKYLDNSTVGRKRDLGVAR
ncbi:acyltransferase family protein [Tunturiibacter lichenicola]|uniref:acyltransferase family protein n=1 Tax=Tunturiibacter lichenicola TaxID=2051959 RepID=UPI003D9B93D5